MLDQDLLETQADYESASLTVGAQAYKERQDKLAQREGFERRDDVSKMIRGAIPILSAGIGEWLEEAKAAKGRKPVGFRALDALELDRDLVALIGLNYTFRELGGVAQVSTIAIKIGYTIQVELEARSVCKQSPKEAKRYLAMIEGQSSDEVNRMRHERLIGDLSVDLGWTRATQALVGQTVLAVMLLKLDGMFQQVTTKGPNGTIKVVQLTDEAAQMLAGMTEAMAYAKPIFQPMLVPPTPWTSIGTGAYKDQRLTRLVPLVRTFSSEHRKLLRAAISDGSMREVLDAVNAIQETRWAVDARVLAMVKWVRDQGLRPSKSFPATDVPKVPKRMKPAEWAQTPPAKRIALSRKRGTIRDLVRGAGVAAMAFNTDVETAAFLAEYGAFYLPHSLDFRGRVYAIPQFNHQRSDHMKALFHFADAMPLGVEGGDWLMIHLANCGDFGKVSKKSLAERIAWVRDNEADILCAARFPTETYDYWSKAGSPFCFLQACFEYDAWMQSGFSQEFGSTIAVAADGSCSGLQHYSCITRSKEEAYHVNLLPRDDVGDIYSISAARAVSTLETAVKSGDDIAALVLANGFGRSDVKRNVMTYFYGSARFGMRDQHMADTMRPLSDRVAMGEVERNPYEVEVEREDAETGQITKRMDGGYSCANVMAAHTYAAVVAVAPKADEAASWIQSVAAVLAHEGQSMVWRTPTGLPVVQRYSEYTSKVVNMWLYDRKVRVADATSTDKVLADDKVLTRVTALIREAPTKRIEKKRMKSASAPNVIHSMDGAHLQRSVAMGHKAGIRHFAMIHDSFGTHAGSMALFGRIVREALIATYEDYCPLAELDRYARSVLSEEGCGKLPPLPERGDLDLNAIRDSLYAFA